ncbi:uncharacterized protein MELLADRAFT_107704 [Melampsora larici-populina 98AG31]|uniref:F-box domain-containing protein n=1 Tax=Melampsora larici-populina (strain 98AG31 / pathotype 3-4-7) TaxID=747676 RepID=F4RQN9_MELLP|nr:uncharacterized protein MELLADRAFT_107704 [Melampsora larici-populina 98AG31]EGG05289.1 hypothetical protein MELLADRAFT_107704 [Melampsora larici-populina 98AG31]
MPSLHPLPVEVVERIISFLCIMSPSTPTEEMNSADQPFLTHQTFVDLLKLRLLARAWAAAIPTFIYSSLYLKKPFFNQYAVRMWNNYLFVSNLANLRRLCLDQLLYIPASKADGYHMGLSDECSDQFELEYSHSRILLLTLRNTLEALTVNTIPIDLPRSIRIGGIPNLRIIHCKQISYFRHHPVWFDWALFNTIEVFIVDYRDDKAYWKRFLRTPGGPHLKEAVKLKKFIFVTGDDDLTQDSELENMLKSYGIRCDFVSEMTHKDMLVWRQRKGACVLKPPEVGGRAPYAQYDWDLGKFELDIIYDAV